MIPHSYAGKNVKCPKCQGVFIPHAKSQNITAALNIKLDDDELDTSTYAHPHTKYCHHCGVKIAALAEICPKCGVRQPGQRSASSRERGDSPNKVVACLFAFFLGWFGAHKFHLGQTMWGVFYLLINTLLCWAIIVPVVFAFVCLIEGLMYLTYKDSDFAEKYARE
jgi:TM2 domain-containing membrane protein YozV